MKKKYIRHFLIPAAAISSALALGLFFGLNSWNQNLYVQWSPSKGRGLAGESSSKEFLNINYENFSQQAESILFSKHETIEKDRLKAFYLGNFLVRDPKSKEHRFICQVFPLVEFSFTALGARFSSGESLMLIQSPCAMEDENFIGPFWIPYKDILSQPEKRVFNIEEKETFIRFYNASIELMPEWLLKSVRFFNPEEQDQEFIVRFMPGEGSPYFELTLKDEEDSTGEFTVEPSSGSTDIN